MTSIISDRLVCGNCAQTVDITINFSRYMWCTKQNRLVMNHDPCCTSFRWTGQTDSDNRLLRFPREAQEVPFLNA